jgi:hypothetical protein
MNWDNIDWKNFDCVKMSRAIKDEFDARFKTIDELVDYLEETRRNKKNQTILEN